MVIRCPECATRFRVADHLVGDKPVKLKCSKCQHVFTYTRTEEETGPKPSHPRMPVVRPAGVQIGAPAPAVKTPPAAVPPPPPPAPEEPAEPRVSTFESFESEEPAPPPVAEPAAAEPAAAEPEPAPQAEVSYKSYTPLSAPLTLEDVLPEIEQSSRAPKIVVIVIGCVLGLLALMVLFVLWRNAWDAGGAASDPFKAFRVAFGFAERRIVPEAADGIEPAVTDSFIVKTADGRDVLIVSGEVLNTTVFPKGEVTVAISIRDSEGSVVMEHETIAGVTLITRERMEQMTGFEILNAVEEEKDMALGWIVRSNRRASFQAIFSTFPAGVEDEDLFSITSTVIYATNAESEEPAEE